MPTKAWSATRERQHAHIKDSLLESGEPVPMAQAVAARTVNKEWVQHVESVAAAEAAQWHRCVMGSGYQ